MIHHLFRYRYLKLKSLRLPPGTTSTDWHKTCASQAASQQLEEPDTALARFTAQPATAQGAEAASYVISVSIECPLAMHAADLGQ